jgi:hypothetical protein
MSQQRKNFENGKRKIENENVPDKKARQFFMCNSIHNHYDHEQKKPERSGTHKPAYENGWLFIFRIQQINVIEKKHDRKKSENKPGLGMNFFSNRSCIPIPKSATDYGEEDEISEGIFFEC